MAHKCIHAVPHEGSHVTPHKILHAVPHEGNHVVPHKDTCACHKNMHMQYHVKSPVQNHKKVPVQCHTRASSRFCKAAGIGKDIPPGKEVKSIQLFIPPPTDPPTSHHIAFISHPLVYKTHSYLPLPLVN